MKKLPVLFVIIILVSCGTSKKTIELDLQPEWIKQKPIVSGYYVGVGSAKKIGTVPQYTAKAWEDALADLASEVSTQVSSTSVLHTIETEFGLAESFSQRIETNTSDYLEGFEPVESWENEDSYWVYFRINKAVYLEKKTEKKEAAIAVALSNYEAGLKEKEMNNPKEALTFYLKGLLAIKSYLMENTPANFNGARIDVGNELYSSLNFIVNNLEIIPGILELKVKRENRFEEPVQFSVIFNDTIAKGVPVKFKYSGGYLEKDHDTSDEWGKVSIQQMSINSRNGQETIEASIDLKGIAQKAVDDLFIRGLLAERNVKPAIVKLFILKPFLSIEFDKNECYEFDCSQITDVFSDVCFKSGYSTSKPSVADYRFLLNLDFKNGINSGGLYSMYLNLEMVVQDQTGDQVWTKKVENIKGIGKSKPEARKLAYEELVSNLNKIYFKRAIDQLR